LKRSKVILSVFVVGVVFGLVVLVTRPEPPPNPVYKGIPLSEWLSMASWRLHDWEWERKGAHPREAIRAIGTNALPMISAELKVRDSKLMMWMYKKADDRGWTDRLPEPAWGRHMNAIYACEYLGDDALPLIPLIADLLSAKADPMSQWQAAWYLESLGERAAEAIPALEAAVRNKTFVDRGETNDLAARALAAIRGADTSVTNLLSP
jgi:hypothetical protein